MIYYTFSGDELLGLIFLIALSLFVTISVNGDVRVFILSGLFVSSFLVYGQMLESWVLTLYIIATVIMIAMQFGLNLLYSTLLTMILLTLLSVTSGNSFFGASLSSFVDNSMIVNGTTTVTTYAETVLFFNFDSLLGFTNTITMMIALAGIIGLVVISTGMNSYSVKVIVLSTIMLGIWWTLTQLGGQLIFDIPEVGQFIWIVFTMVFVVGFLMKFMGGGGSDD